MIGGPHRSFWFGANESLRGHEGYPPGLGPAGEAAGRWAPPGPTAGGEGTAAGGAKPLRGKPLVQKIKKGEIGGGAKKGKPILGKENVQTVEN